MDTVITGMFITTRGWKDGSSANRPRCRIRDDGTFALQMPLINVLRDGRKETYIATWSGPEAQDWWQAHQHIGSGQPLDMELTNPVIDRANLGMAIFAQVRRCRLLKRPTPSPSFPAQEEPNHDHHHPARSA